MAFPPDLQRRPGRLLGWLRQRGQPRRKQLRRHRSRWQQGRSPGRRNLGSALVQALMAGLIAVIGALLLASRLFSSRYNSGTRSDLNAAREAAESGLNELQAQLNTNRYGYLWVTRSSVDASGNVIWASVTPQDLTACDVSALDLSGNQLTSLPSAPAGVGSPKEIRNAAGTRITYQLSGFEPPSYPGATPAGACNSNSTAAAKFGNLNGGSAIIRVVGSVTRGSGASAKTTNVTLSRRVHVLSPAQELKFSFIILGNAYNATCVDGKTKVPNCTPDTSPISPSSFGAITDISRLNVLDGNICYGTPSDCSSPLELTVIGCADLDSCIVNNVDTVSGKTRNGFCTQKVKKKKKKSIICNGYQQAGEMPPVFSLNEGAPNSVGFIGYNDNTPTAFSNQSWTKHAKIINCDSKASDTKCDGIDSKSGKVTSKKARFPYTIEGTSTGITAAPSSLANAKALKNSDLVFGCYFNNTDGSPDAKGDKSTAINCLADQLKIADSTSSSANLMVYTKSSATGAALLPVNIFIDGFSNKDGKVQSTTFTDGGLQNIDTGLENWFNLRIIGHNRQARNSSDTTQPILCDQQRITSKKDDDINGAWIWLPNGWLEYDKTDSKDSAYNVIWTCKFTAPVKGKSTGYKIITPKNLDPIIRTNLIRSLPGFSTAAGGTYRGYGSEDSPAS